MKLYQDIAANSGPNKRIRLKAEHLFVSDSDGGLYDTRVANWHSKPPLRPVYSRVFRCPENAQQLKATLRNPFVWPGGYEIVFTTNDGALLCRDCVLKNLRSCLDAMRDSRDHSGWRISGVSYEAVSADCAREISEDLISQCDHCAKEFGELAG